MNREICKRSVRFCLLLLVFGSTYSFAQDLKKPILGFSDACASEDFNNFSVEFRWNPTPIVASNNQFILELSDAQGNFSSPTTLTTLRDKNTVFDFTFNFEMPKTVRGENYKVRVRSTNPAKISPTSNSFGAYFLKVEEPLVVNNFKNAIVCNGTTAHLEVNNYPNETSYNWYKDMVLIPDKHTASIAVSEPGIYFAEIDYGSYCSTSTASNLVEVYVENTLGIELIGDKNISLCEDQTYTLTTNITDESLVYAWYKDDELIIKNNNYSLEVKGSDPNFAGAYHVEIERPSGCNEKTSVVQIEAGNFELNISATNEGLILPEQTVSLEVNTNALSPTFEWYRNGELLPDETSEVLKTLVAGNYYVKVTQRDGCVASKTSEVILVSKPSAYEATINAANYIACQATPVTLKLKEVKAINENGSPYVLNLETLSNIKYQWVYNDSPLVGETSNTLKVSEASLNGMYRLKVFLEEGIEILSNIFEVKLGLLEVPKLTASGNVICDNRSFIEISSSVKNEEYQYTWYRNDVALTETTSTFTTNVSGMYVLEVWAFGCSVRSAPYIINDFDNSVVTIDAPETITIPEGSSKLITASGGDFYQWFNSKNELIGSTSSVNLSEEGAYTLLASVGNCQVVKELKVTNVLSSVIPNVITPNGDGFNDLWIIPKVYAYQKDITVNIYEQSGTMVFSTNDYQNNWPESSSIKHSGNRPPIYYYKITKGKETLKRGTITIIE